MATSIVLEGNRFRDYHRPSWLSRVLTGGDRRQDLSVNFTVFFWLRSVQTGITTMRLIEHKKGESHP
jgi:hypothetical protein